MDVKIKSANTVLVFVIMWLYLLLYQLTVSGVLPLSPFYPWKTKTQTPIRQSSISNMYYWEFHFTLYHTVLYSIWFSQNITIWHNAITKNSILCIWNHYLSSLFLNGLFSWHVHIHLFFNVFPFIHVKLLCCFCLFNVIKNSIKNSSSEEHWVYFAVYVFCNKIFHIILWKPTMSQFSD